MDHTKIVNRYAVYSEYRYYSPIKDADMVRLSMADAHNREFYMAIPESGGKRYRERRDEALGHIMTAIESGLQPGQVRVRDGDLRATD